MTKKVLDLTTKKPLIDRQRTLWAQSDAIERAQIEGRPLSKNLSDWLVVAFRNIAHGMDANEAFCVKPEKKGVRKNGLWLEHLNKYSNGYISAATEATSDGSKRKKTVEAIDEISKALPSKTKSTIKKNWNKASTDRKPTFTFGKK